MTLTLDRIVAGATRLGPDGNLGSHVTEALTWQQACEMAGLQWQAVARPAYYRGVEGKSYQRIEHAQVIARGDTGAFLAYMGGSYQPVQHTEVGDMLTPIVESGNGKFLKAGELGGGEQVYGIVQLGDDVELDLPTGDGYLKDGYRPLLVLRASHHGRATRLDLMVLRLVCANGLTLPVAARSLAIRHVGDTATKIEEAGKAVAMWATYRERFEQAASRLVAKKMSWEEIGEFTTRLFPSKEADGDEPPAQTAERREALVTVLRQAPDLQAIQNTGWGVLQAVVEYADHVVPYADTKRSNGDERRFLSMLDGNAAELQDRAYRLLTARS